MGMSNELKVYIGVTGLSLISSVGILRYNAPEDTKPTIILNSSKLQTSPDIITAQTVLPTREIDIPEVAPTEELLKDEERKEHKSEKIVSEPTPKVVPTSTIAPTRVATPASKLIQTADQKPQIPKPIATPIPTEIAFAAISLNETKTPVISNPLPNSISIEQIVVKTPTLTPKREYKIDDYITMFAETAGISFAYAKQIANCESGLIPTSRNASGASGLWQIMLPLHNEEFTKRGWNPEVDWRDPYKNTVVAMALLKTPQGLNHWNCA